MNRVALGIGCLHTGCNHPEGECIGACVHSGPGRPMTLQEIANAEGGGTQPVSALDTQVGGGHYKDMVIQPVEFIHLNKIGFIEGNVIKYVSRWKSKGGVEDLRKARHFLDLLIEMEASRG